MTAKRAPAKALVLGLVGGCRSILYSGVQASFYSASFVLEGADSLLESIAVLVNSCVAPCRADIIGAVGCNYWQVASCCAVLDCCFLLCFYSCGASISTVTYEFFVVRESSTGSGK